VYFTHQWQKIMQSEGALSPASHPPLNTSSPGVINRFYFESQPTLNARKSVTDFDLNEPTKENNFIRMMRWGGLAE